jgi:hypothetical protein
MADPSSFARNAVIETQSQYSKANKPRWARGAIGGGLMTFKTYSISYLELMQRMWTQGGPEGKYAVGWALAMLLRMSGAGGVPFMEDAEDLIDGASQMMGCNISAKQWRKQLLADVVARSWANSWSKVCLACLMHRLMCLVALAWVTAYSDSAARDTRSWQSELMATQLMRQPAAQPGQ